MRPSLRAAAAAARRVARAARDTPPAAGQVLRLDYPAQLRSRWGYGEPAHPELAALLETGRERYAGHLASFLPFLDELAAIPLESADGHGPSWVNGYFQGLDAVALYGFLGVRQPATYLEIGAGHSTRFARAAIAAHSLATKIVSIDPAPRAALEGLTDRHVRCPLEDVDPAEFERLTGADVLLMDGSHRSLPNSDATVFFTEILPRLPRGLLVGIDDVFLPWDYPAGMVDRWYSEQYLLAAWLLAGERLEVALPNFWVCTQPELHRILAPLWDRLLWSGIATNATTFWLTVS